MSALNQEDVSSQLDQMNDRWLDHNHPDYYYPGRCLAVENAIHHVSEVFCLSHIYTSAAWGYYSDKGPTGVL